MLLCSVLNCPNSDKRARRNKKGQLPQPPVKFFSFPKDEVLAQIWEQKCQQDYIINTATAFMCSNHFKPEHELLNYTQKNRREILKVAAIPTENLPDQPDDLYDYGHLESTEFINTEVPPENVEPPEASLKNVKLEVDALETSDFLELQTSIKQETEENWSDSSQEFIKIEESAGNVDPTKTSLQNVIFEEHVIESSDSIESVASFEEKTQYLAPDGFEIQEHVESAGNVDPTETSLQNVKIEEHVFELSDSFESVSSLEEKTQYLAPDGFEIQEHADKSTMTNICPMEMEIRKLRAENTQLKLENYSLKASNKVLIRKFEDLQTEFNYLEEESRYSISKMFQPRQRRNVWASRIEKAKSKLQEKRLFSRH